MRLVRTVAAAATLLALVGCAPDDAEPAPASPGGGTHSRVGSPVPARSTSPPVSPSAPASTATRAPAPRRVLAISIDGLSVDAITALGEEGAPAIYRLLDEGAGTLNARTEVEQTVTLPNHAGMMTGRRVDASQGGHGVTWDEEIPDRIVPGQGGGVASVFTQVHAAGGSTALFAAKTKFDLYDRSWPDAIDTFVVDTDDAALEAKVRDDLLQQPRTLSFVHFAAPDLAGHASGWMSPAYLDAVAATDALVRDLLDTIDGHPELRSSVVVILTTDHGGVAGTTGHSDASARSDYRIPFLVWGPGIAHGDLYALNPDYADPGDGQPSYNGAQPVRNADLADLALTLLDLPSVPGSQLDAAQDLTVKR